MRTVAIIQSRMGSSRLPGKSLADLCGAPVLQRVIERTSRAHVDEVVVATTVRPEDDPIVDLATSLDVRVYRGSAGDVLGRYVGALQECNADVVVRITADCPLIDPTVIDHVASRLYENADMVSNAILRSWPKGLDVEAVWSDVLLRLDRMVSTPQGREHVLWSAYREDLAHLFRCVPVVATVDHSDLNWCLDTAADLEHLRALWEDAPWQQLVVKDLALSLLRAVG